MIVVVKTRKQMKEEPVVVTHIGGKLTREGAVIEARNLYGEDGTISSTDELPFLVWKIGEFGRTIGRSWRSWEEAIERSRARNARTERKAT